MTRDVEMTCLPNAPDSIRGPTTSCHACSCSCHGVKTVRNQWRDDKTLTRRNVVGQHSSTGDSLPLNLYLKWQIAKQEGHKSGEALLVSHILWTERAIYQIHQTRLEQGVNNM